jgi:hypothetical protein
MNDSQIGYTALIIAAIVGRTACLHVLVEGGADTEVECKVRCLYLCLHICLYVYLCAFS